MGKKGLTVKEIAVFSMLGAVMFISYLLMEWAPNIHFLGMFTVTFTVVYRKKALIPIYLYVLLTGLIYGFNTWWYPYLYIWTVLWGVTMLLPRDMKKAVAVPVYVIVCALHGLCFGLLYAPFQALVFGLNFKGTLAWIAAGLPFDALHCAGNAVAGFLILPLSQLLKKLNGQIGI